VEGSGKDSGQRRVNDILEDNITIEVITRKEIATAILQMLQKDNSPSFAVKTYSSEVHFVRIEKYT
jgi:hypothetical protein